MTTRRLLLAAALLLLSVGACSERRLVPVENEDLRTYDDRLELEAEFCTRTAEEVVFPVKLLLVLDGSGSLQFTDQSGVRRAAVLDLLSSLSTQDNVYVSTLIFGSNIYTFPPVDSVNPTYFVPARELAANPPPVLGIGDVQTNYHGGLSAIHTHLLMDMLQSDPAELARTKYVVIFFSDGAPSPVCCISAEETVGDLGEIPFGCAPEPWEVAQAGIPYCEGSEEQTICNDQDWLDTFRDLPPPEDGEGNIPDYGDGTLAALNELEPGDNYNRIYQIEDLVSEIMELGETFGVGELRLHTTLLFDSTLPDAVKQIYRLNRCRSEQLLRRMAELGNGVFRDFENSDEIDFLSFNFTALKQSFTLVGTMAQNANALPTPDGFLPDSDGDGLDDDTELALGTDPAVSDSDKLPSPPSATEVPQLLPPEQWGDGYSDFIERSLSELGYDPRYTLRPLPPADRPNLPRCPPNSSDGVDQSDLDGDGLNGCEESLYGTNVERADSDGDGLSDFVEVRAGLDPARHEGARDDDFDGVKNLDEVRRGTDPGLPDEDQRRGDSVRYELIERGVTDDGRQCYTAKVSGLRLVTTEPRFPGGRSGYNDVYFWIAESPADNPTGRTDLRFACVRTQYIKPTYKDPPQGKVTLDEDAFVDLSGEGLERVLNGEDVCVGRRVQ